MRWILTTTIALGGCTYNWSTPSAPSDSGAAHDSTISEAAPQEAAVSEEAPPAPDSSLPPDCATLRGELTAARANAMVCVSGPSACSTTFPDECSCPVVVGDNGGVATASFNSAVEAYVAAGCDAGCSTCGTPNKYLCIVSDAGGYACHQ
jgi:hypothetical protein